MRRAGSPTLAIGLKINPYEYRCKNYYPNTYFKYCDKNSSQFYGKTKASKRCAQYYTEHQKKTFNVKKWYWVHIYFEWKTPDGKWHKKDYWYYCQYHKYDDPDSTKPYFKAWVTYKPTGEHYWESYYKGPQNF